MSVDFRPLGMQCNLRCQYCYQNVLRDAEPARVRFDFAAATRALEEMKAPPHLSGGEPLLLSLAQLEAIFRYGKKRFGHAGSVQTNGTLLTKAHVRLFTRYDVHVGVSVGGPGELNDARWAGSLARTRASTAATLAAIDRLVVAGRPPGLMIQLSRTNAAGDRLSRLCNWLAEMDRKGIPSARVQVLELDNTAAREAHGLTVEENVQAFRRLAALNRMFETLRLDIFDDKRQLLMMEDDSAECAFRACDPLSTPALEGAGGTGEYHKCGLTDKEGVNFLVPTEQGFERYLALYQTPQQYGGCSGCRFFVVCKGQCPGTGIEGDWRNRSESCEVWRRLFALTEEDLLAEGRTPISLHPRRSEVEAALLAAWASGVNPTLGQIRIQLVLRLEPTQQTAV